MKENIKHILLVIKQYIDNYPKIKIFFIFILNNFPRLKERVQNMLISNFEKQLRFNDLSKEEKEIFKKLKKLMDNSQGKHQ